MRPTGRAPGLPLEGGGGFFWRWEGREGTEAYAEKSKEARQKAAEASICDGQQEWV